MRSYPGVGLQEFERFKQDFRWAAFTCRLWSCPLAAVGFENEGLRLTHEVSHRRFVCVVPGCQYPSFTSAKSLKAHYANCHGKGADLKRRTIRQEHVPNSGSGQKFVKEGWAGFSSESVREVIPDSPNATIFGPSVENLISDWMSFGPNDVFGAIKPLVS